MPKREEGSSPNGLVIRCSDEWREWLKRAAEHEQGSMAAFIDHAVRHYARKIGFKEGAPKR
jgi:uncharacterized protein (DUF1778 family)